MIRRYPIGADRELRIATSAHDHLLVIAVHDVNRCISGPLAVPFIALDTLRSALADVAGETGAEHATEPARAGTKRARATTNSRRAQPEETPGR